MERQELSHNGRIQRLAELTQELRQSHTTEQTLRAFEHGFAEGGQPLISLFLSTRGLTGGQYRLIRMALPGPHETSVDPMARTDAIHRGGIVSAVIDTQEAQLIQDVDWSDDWFFHEFLKEYGSLIAIPVANSQLPMNWVLLLRKAPHRFTVSDFENAMERVVLGGALLENQLLTADLTRAHKLIDREARQVGKLQRALLPDSVPQIAGLDIATSYEPCSRAGGDLYDVFPLKNLDADSAPNRWCILIGDAAGHGLAAAMVMAIVQAVLRAHPAGISSPAALLSHANRQLCSQRIGGFFTAFLGIYEPATRRLVYANAGHPAPLLKSATTGSFAALDAVLNFPLGIDEIERFEESAIDLQAGDDVLLYTDGIIELRNAHGEFFNQDRLDRLFACGNNGPDSIVRRIRAAISAFNPDQPAPDDQTVVAVRVL